MDDNKINKNMTTDKQETQPTAQVQKQPDERGSFHLQGHIKIFDPETKEVFVDKHRTRVEAAVFIVRIASLFVGVNSPVQ